MRTSKIKSVESLGLQTVYDISIKDDHSYVSKGGIINHNTTSSEIKRMFIPDPGHIILEVDYSQAELRLVAELSKDTAMIDIFKRGYNIHMATACKINGVLDKYNEMKAIEGDPNHPDNLFWVKQKKRAKTINFGILYGEGPSKLSEQLGCSVEEAKKQIKQWFAAYPQVEKWITDQHNFAHKHGYVKNLFGRKRRLPDALYTIAQAKRSDLGGKRAEALRQSVNSPIQGGSSDLTQLAGIEVWEQTKKGLLPESLKELATVHDSIVYQILPQDLHKTVPKLLKICDNPNTLEWFGFKMEHVNMKVSAEVGVIDWGDKKDYNPWENYTKTLNTLTQK